MLLKMTECQKLCISLLKVTNDFEASIDICRRISSHTATLASRFY